MRLEARQDFDRSRARVVARFRDPARIEHALTQAGLRLERMAVGSNPAWRCAVHWQGALQTFDLTQVDRAGGDAMDLQIDSALARGVMALTFRDGPDDGCVLTARVTLTAKTLAARVAMQGLRLARGRAEDRLRRLLIAVVRG